MCRRQYTTEETLLINTIKKLNTRCYYCGNKVGMNYRTVDHKTPISRGGETILENLCMSCEKCNSEKAFLTEEEYKEYKKVADMRVNKNVKVIALNSLLDSYKEDSESAIYEKKRLSKINKEIDNIILTIRASKVGDWYKLCKMLQDKLVERDIANNKLITLENKLRNSKKHKKQAKRMLLLTENKIRNEYKKEYVSIKDIELIGCTLVGKPI